MNIVKGILNFGIGLGASAAGAVILGIPGGAASGAIFTVSLVFGNFLAEKLIGDPSLDSKDTVGAISLAARTTVMIISGWKLAALFGVNMTLKTALILHLTSWIILFGVCLGVSAIVLIVINEVRADKNSSNRTKPIIQTRI